MNGSINNRFYYPWFSCWVRAVLLFIILSGFQILALDYTTPHLLTASTSTPIYVVYDSDTGDYLVSHGLWINQDNRPGQNSYQVSNYFRSIRKSDSQLVNEQQNFMFSYNNGFININGENYTSFNWTITDYYGLNINSLISASLNDNEKTINLELQFSNTGNESFSWSTQNNFVSSGTISANFSSTVTLSETFSEDETLFIPVLINGDFYTSVTIDLTQYDDNDTIEKPIVYGALEPAGGGGGGNPVENPTSINDDLGVDLSGEGITEDDPIDKVLQESDTKTHTDDDAPPPPTPEGTQDSSTYKDVKDALNDSGKSIVLTEADSPEWSLPPDLTRLFELIYLIFQEGKNLPGNLTSMVSKIKSVYIPKSTQKKYTIDWDTGRFGVKTIAWGRYKEQTDKIRQFFIYALYLISVYQFWLIILYITGGNKK